MTPKKLKMTLGLILGLLFFVGLGGPFECILGNI
jgi:hypothetical protein